MNAAAVAAWRAPLFFWVGVVGVIANKVTECGLGQGG